MRRRLDTEIERPFADIASTTGRCVLGKGSKSRSFMAVSLFARPGGHWRHDDQTVPPCNRQRSRGFRMIRLDAVQRRYVSEEVETTALYDVDLAVETGE